MRARIEIEADLIEARVAAGRCPRVMDAGRSAWDVAHRSIDCLLHEWRATVAAEAARLRILPETA